MQPTDLFDIKADPIDPRLLDLLDRNAEHVAEQVDALTISLSSSLHNVGGAA